MSHFPALAGQDIVAEYEVLDGGDESPRERLRARTKGGWPADRVEKWPIDLLVPYARNARTHSEAQIGKIAASLREFGWTNPVLAREDGGIIAGHGRVLAAKQLGIRQVPVMVASGWSDSKIRAYILADNRLALDAGWDEDLLRIELSELREADFDLTLTGFDDLELEKLLAEKTEGLTDPDDLPDPPPPTSELGDVWILGGRHRVVCGDSTDADVVGSVLAGVKPHLMTTDPPYGVNYDPDWRNRAMRTDGSAIGGRAVGQVSNDDKADWREAWALFPGDVAYVWHAGLYAGTVAESLMACDFVLRSQIVWVKSNFAIGRGDYHWHHEPCWYAVRKGKTGHYNGDRKQTTVWQIPKPSRSETGHGTQKPVECMLRPIENNSSPGQAIYDPFLGSGTTIIACEQSGRIGYGVELDPSYVDLICVRYMSFTGNQVILEQSGKTFGEVTAERGVGPVNN